MKLSLIRVLPLAIALLVPSAALAEDGAKDPAGSAKPKVTQTAKRTKSHKAKAAKAPKAAKKAAAPKASKKAPKASKKTAAK